MIEVRRSYRIKIGPVWLGEQLRFRGTVVSPKGNIVFEGYGNNLEAALKIASRWIEDNVKGRPFDERPM